MTMHTPDETVSCIRKKPRVNAVNKVNLDRIWGENFARMIKIPKVIDDYNHWMGGIDRNDQLISNYCHQLHCKRIWMPSCCIHWMCSVSMHTWRMLGSKLTRRIGLNRKSLFCRWWRSCKNEPLSWSTGGSDLPMNTPTLLPLQISDRGSTPVSLVCPFKGCNPPWMTTSILFQKPEALVSTAAF